MILVILKVIQNFYVLIILYARMLQKKVITLFVCKTAILSFIGIINDVLLFMHVIFLMSIFYTSIEHFLN